MICRVMILFWSFGPLASAASLFPKSGEKQFEQQARYDQYDLFVNLGHAWLPQPEDSSTTSQFTAFIRLGKEDIRFYRRITGDETQLRTEAALLDWPLGCNPWGTDVISGFPAGGDYPDSPYPAYPYLLHQSTTGGLEDAPVYRNIYENIQGIHLFDADKYQAFPGGKAAHHNDKGDYPSNEPVIDSTASFSCLFSSPETANRGRAGRTNAVKDSQGAIVRMDTTSRTVYLIFSAHDLNEGGQAIRKSLKKQKIKASFFFTGGFYADPENQSLLRQLKTDGHFLGAHSDCHLLYADWNRRDSLLVDRQQFEADLKSNYLKIKNLGIRPETVTSFLPPYEWYNRIVVDWARQLGLTVINFTPGIRTNADYTTPGMPNYQSSDAIFNSLYQFERNDPHGLNGCLILIHLGTDPARKDKFYSRLEELITFLKKKGYHPDRLKE